VKASRTDARAGSAQLTIPHVDRHAQDKSPPTADEALDEI
jgi:hypothetical protein